jgi:hypothetical protein
MRHKMLTQRALFCIDVMAKRAVLSQHFVMHAVASSWTLEELWRQHQQSIISNFQLQGRMINKFYLA